MCISSPKSIAKGFFAMIAAVSIFSIIALFRSGDSWLGLLYFLILLIPLTGVAYFWHSRKNRSSLSVNSYEKWTNLLLGLQGVALACWAYDLATTFYAINIAQVAFEINPLGWPFGALGALVYYAPTVILTCVLLLKIKQKTSVYAAVPMTFVMLLMGSMNLNAGIGNFQFFLSTAALPTQVRYNLLAIIFAADMVWAVALATATRRQIFSRQEKLNTSEQKLS
jgi:hypothetical protein